MCPDGSVCDGNADCELRRGLSQYQCRVSICRTPFIIEAINCNSLFFTSDEMQHLQKKFLITIQK